MRGQTGASTVKLDDLLPTSAKLQQACRKQPCLTRLTTKEDKDERGRGGKASPKRTRRHRLPRCKVDL